MKTRHKNYSQDQLSSHIAGTGNTKNFRPEEQQYVFCTEQKVQGCVWNLSDAGPTFHRTAVRADALWCI